MIGYAVISTVATGSSDTDRLLEIAIAVLDPDTLETLSEHATLLNPMRGIGRGADWGITASALEAAPTFEEAAGGLFSVLNRRVLIGHGLERSLRHLEEETRRCKRVSFKGGDGRCVAELIGEPSLRIACEQNGVPFPGAAEVDAVEEIRAVSELYRRLADRCEDEQHSPAVCSAYGRNDFRTVVRSKDRLVNANGLLGPANSTRQSRAERYQVTMDGALDDWVVDPDERSDMAASASSLPAGVVAGINENYLNELVDASRRDGRISPDEERAMRRTAFELGLWAADIPKADPPEDLDDLLSTKVRIFAGRVRDEDDHAAINGRNALRSLIQDAGHHLAESSSPGDCDILVEDRASQSKAAVKARRHRIPIVPAGELEAALRQRLGRPGP